MVFISIICWFYKEFVTTESDFTKSIEKKTTSDKINTVFKFKELKISYICAIKLKLINTL